MGKIIKFFILLINLLVLVLSRNKRSKTKTLSKSKNKGVFLIGPFSYYRGIYGGLRRPSFSFLRTRPIVWRSSYSVPLSQYSVCPAMNFGRRLIGKTRARCRSPCTPQDCVQLSFECCVYESH